jgi:RNA polymerase sigma factor (sigma-70 family)
MMVRRIKSANPDGTSRPNILKCRNRQRLSNHYSCLREGRGGGEMTPMRFERKSVALRELRTLFSEGTIRDLTDGQLLERIATESGEAAEQAFSALFERHGAMVLRVCRGVLVDTHEIEDAFQATFLVLVKKARSLWVRDSLGPWLHQVAFRTASCARKLAARRRRHEQLAAASANETHSEPEDELERVLHEEIERLPDRYRAPVVLCDLEGRTHEQAARHLGWPIGTVKSRQSRARERLRQRLLRRGVGYNPGPAGRAVLVPPALLHSTPSAVVLCVTSRAIAQGSAALSLMRRSAAQRSATTFTGLRGGSPSKMRRTSSAVFVLSSA